MGGEGPSVWHQAQPPSQPPRSRPAPKRGHHAVSVGGGEHDPLAPWGWAGKREFQEGWRCHYCLRSPGPWSSRKAGDAAIACGPLGPALALSPPKRTCFADPQSRPETRRARVCKYSLKWKHRDCSWTRFQDGDISSRHESQPSRPGETPPTQPVNPRCRLQSGAWWWEGAMCPPRPELWPERKI